jgi:hypothetical protein
MVVLTDARLQVAQQLPQLLLGSSSSSRHRGGRRGCGTGWRLMRKCAGGRQFVTGC